eukprot:COSAG04_NODE_325_length_16785_cov_23.851792_20_plen_380_part_00
MGSLSALFRPLVSGPTPTFSDAIEDIGGVLGQDFVRAAMRAFQMALAMREQRGPSALSAEGFAFIFLYSAEQPPLYRELSNKCRDFASGSAGPAELRPFGPYTVGLLKHMKQTAPCPNCNVFRALNMPWASLREEYGTVGNEVTFWGWTTCSERSEVAVQFMQFGGPQAGGGALFQIALTQRQARRISEYSQFPAEDEILLPPGCRFRVESVIPGNAQGMHTVVTLMEVTSDEWILDLNPDAPDVPDDSDSFREGECAWLKKIKPELGQMSRGIMPVRAAAAEPADQTHVDDLRRKVPPLPPGPPSFCLVPAQLTTRVLRRLVTKRAALSRSGRWARTSAAWRAIWPSFRPSWSGPSAPRARSREFGGSSPRPGPRVTT